MNQQLERPTDNYYKLQTVHPPNIKCEQRIEVGKQNKQRHTKGRHNSKTTNLAL